MIEYSLSFFLALNIYWRFLNGIIGEVRFKKSATEEKNTIYVKLKNTKSNI